MKLRYLLLLVSVLVFTMGPAHAAAQERSVVWERFDVAIQVQPDGSIDVVETQQIRFQGQFQRGTRSIPTARTTGISGVRVSELQGGQERAYTQGSGRAGTYAARLNDAGDVQVDWLFPPTANAVRTFVVRYRAAGAVRIHDAGDQLQWQAVYANRDAPVQASTVTVTLPGDVQPSDLQTAWYRIRAQEGAGAAPVGGSGEVAGPRSVYFGVGSLPANVGAEVRVQFPPGVITAPPPPWQADADRADWARQTLAPIGSFLALLMALMVGAGGAVVLFITWRARGRDPDIGAVADRLDEPPSDLPAPLAGTLVDEVANVRDAVATLVDLANRGILEIEDVTNPKLVGSTRDVQITLREDQRHPALRAYERTLLVGLFGSNASPGDQVNLSGIQGRFAAVIPALQAQLEKAVADERLLNANPGEVRRSFRQAGWSIVFVGVGLAVVAAVVLGEYVGLAWLPGAVLALVGLAATRVAERMPRRTAAGALAAARWRAFSRTLAETGGAGRDGARAAAFLPYAVAFGVDRSFLQRLESIGTPPPRWYQAGSGRRMGGPGGVVIVPGGWSGGYGGTVGGGTVGAPTGAADGGGFGAPSPQGWSDSLADLLNAASGAMASGGGSGGWSGGGFGGGGGGGGGSGGFS